MENHGAGEASAVTAPVVEAPQMPTEPVPAARAPIFAEVAQLPPAALPDAHEGEASGVLSGFAHKVADFAKGAVGGLRSDDVDALGNPDGGITPAQVAEASAVHTPIGSHTQAVEERRAHPAPALAVAV
jgi:hypothetical protein